MPDLIQNPEEIQLTERHEILAVMGNPPGWILRWGITIVFFIIIGLLSISYFVEYPDTISASVTLTTQNPPIPVMARADGKLTNLKIQDNDLVVEGELLGIVENPAILEDVDALEDYLVNFDGVEEPKDFIQLPKPQNLILGDMQSSYARLIQLFNDYRHFLRQRAYFRKVENLNDQILQKDELHRVLVQQLDGIEDEIRIAKQTLERTKSLVESGAVAEIDIEPNETAYIQALQKRNSKESEIINNRSAITSLKGQIDDLKGGRTDGHSDKQTEIQETVQSLKSEIKSWKQRYLLKAPISGKVAFTEIWSENQPVQTGQSVMTIIPGEDQGDAGKVIGRAALAVQGSGKVKVGQEVNIRLEAYEYMEYGILKGKVKKMSEVPLDGQYLVEFALPDTLLTTYDSLIVFRQGMIGSADIIAEKRNFLARIFDKLYDIWLNR